MNPASGPAASGDGHEVCRRSVRGPLDVLRDVVQVRAVGGVSQEPVALVHGHRPELLARGDAPGHHGLGPGAVEQYLAAHHDLGGDIVLDRPELFIGVQIVSHDAGGLIGHQEHERLAAGVGGLVRNRPDPAHGGLEVLDVVVAEVRAEGAVAARREE